VLTEENLSRVLDKFNFPNADDMYAAVGYQGVTSALIVTRLTDRLRKEQTEKQLDKVIDSVKADVKERPSPTINTGSGVIVEGVDNVLVRLSRCCNPVPGDDIVGYITKGRGVSVHRVNCPNIQTDQAKERYLNIMWKNAENIMKEYHLNLEISGYDRDGLLNDVLQAINELKTQISKV